ncbi:MAG: transporter substrate-binding domain-containing protein [Campylobacterota bacterium]|nr:transporter substrate-binding domain-containing protein [Campylobacterota bacterium]
MKLIFILSIFISFLIGDIKDNIKLTKDEKQWLSEHKVIKVGVDKNWPPFDFVDKNGIHQGIASDYMKIIARSSIFR